MITSDQEQQVKLQFLDEATDYLDTLESGLLGLGTGAVSDKQLDGLLRAAHSIKGGAAMMGYKTLAGLGHHLEDYFKIIQYGKAAAPDAQIEQLMLATVDKLRQIVALNRQGKDADAAWLEERVNPLFAQLRDRLGEFNPEDEANMLASESGEDILSFMFETEVERSLTQLEDAGDGQNSTSLFDELIVTGEELGGLAEMLELPALATLCQSVQQHLTAQPHRVREISALAIAAWRRTQALVAIGQIGNLPEEIELPGSGIISIRESQEFPESYRSDTPIFNLNEAETLPGWGDDFNVNEVAVVALSEAETVPEWSNINLNAIDPNSIRELVDLQDFSIDPPLTIADLGDEQLADSVQFGSYSGAHDLSTLADPFAEFTSPVAPAFSTITASDELEALELEELDTREHGVESISQDNTTISEPPEIVDAFEMLDLSGDLSFDADIPEIFSELSGFLSDVAPRDISSAVFNIPSKPKVDYLAQEAADLLSALDAAPEVIDDLPHNADSPGAAGSNSTVQVVEQTIRVATKQLEEIGDLFGELTIDRNGLNLHLQGLRQLVINLQLKVKQLEQSNFNLSEAYDASAVDKQDPTAQVQNNPSLSSDFTSELDLLEFDRYSELHILSQEVMDTIVQIEELTTDLDLQLNDAERTNRDLNRTAKQLQTGLTQVRMRPVSELFNRFPRAIRNLSIEHSKPIDLQLKGGTTLIERSTLEALNDPLMHLVRNAFDHGIEPSATRLANGKSAAGKIEISATYRGNQTVITIKDDGGGIDLDKIRAKVKKMGMDDKEIANFKDNELIDLIFEPGFSTAAKVTDLSGRGVGMDVVRTNIRALRGDISVDTKLGQGSTFTITVPFTLSVVRVLLVEVNGLWLAISSNIVEEIILLNPENIISTAGQKMLQWDDFTVRLIQPTQYLHLPEFTTQLATASIPTIDRPTVLMIDQGQDVVALQIDKFWGEQEVTIRHRGLCSQ